MSGSGSDDGWGEVEPPQSMEAGWRLMKWDNTFHYFNHDKSPSLTATSVCGRWAVGSGAQPQKIRGRVCLDCRSLAPTIQLPAVCCPGCNSTVLKDERAERMKCRYCGESFTMADMVTSNRDDTVFQE